MQANMTPIKSAAGVDEIATRGHKLSTRSRTVLIAIDGQRTVAQLQTMFASFGDIGAVLDELAALSLVDTGVGIRALTPAPPTAAAASPPPSASASDPGNTPSGTGEPPTMQARRLMSDVAVAALDERCGRGGTWTACVRLHAETGTVLFRRRTARPAAHLCATGHEIQGRAVRGPGAGAD